MTEGKCIKRSIIKNPELKVCRTLTFLRTDEGLFSGVQALMGLQLSALDERFPAVRIITQVRSFTWDGKRSVSVMSEHMYGSQGRHWPVCVRLCAWSDFSRGKTRLQMLQRMRLEEFSPSLISSRTVSARGRPRRMPSWNKTAGTCMLDRVMHMWPWSRGLHRGPEMEFFMCDIFIFKHLAHAFIQRDLFRLYIYYQYMCSLGIEPTTFALLTQCTTTEPQEHKCDVKKRLKQNWRDTPVIEHARSKVERTSNSVHFLH